MGPRRLTNSSPLLWALSDSSFIKEGAGAEISQTNQPVDEQKNDLKNKRSDGAETVTTLGLEMHCELLQMYL